MITVAIWVYCSKGYHQAKWAVIPKETAISQSAVHSCCFLKQEWLFRTPADTFGWHHNKNKLHSEHATREGFMALGR
jgi:hypothetical protein